MCVCVFVILLFVWYFRPRQTYIQKGSAIYSDGNRFAKKPRWEKRERKEEKKKEKRWKEIRRNYLLRRYKSISLVRSFEKLCVVVVWWARASDTHTHILTASKRLECACTVYCVPTWMSNNNNHKRGKNIGDNFTFTFEPTNAGIPQMSAKIHINTAVAIVMQVARFPLPPAPKLVTRTKQTGYKLFMFMRDDSAMMKPQIIIDFMISLLLLLHATQRTTYILYNRQNRIVSPLHVPIDFQHLRKPNRK